MYSRSFDISGLHSPLPMLKLKYKTQDKEVILRRAAARGVYKDILNLLKYDASLNIHAHSPSTGKTAIHHAAEAGHLKTFRVLEQHAANPFQCDFANQTAVDLAQANGHADIVKYVGEAKFFSIPRELLDQHLLRFLTYKDIQATCKVNLYFCRLNYFAKDALDIWAKCDRDELLSALRNDKIPYIDFINAVPILLMTLTERRQWFTKKFPDLRLNNGLLYDYLSNPLVLIVLKNSYFSQKLLQNILIHNYRHLLSMNFISIFTKKRLSEVDIEKYFIEPFYEWFPALAIRLVGLDLINESMTLERIWECRQRLRLILPTHYLDQNNLAESVAFAESDQEIIVKREPFFYDRNFD